MVKEVVITSVPRGVEPGRTGFQVVMRTAGTPKNVTDALVPLAAYRWVGSGRNPLIYSCRSVRTDSGAFTVLGRTVDAGNDFSLRSNKLAHLLVIDAGELRALQGSSPAAVLAAIDSRLATVWQGGPEERQSPFALPAPPVQPAACKRWHDVKGDAGWGGLLAQRAMRRQASLVIAPDCSPMWCRTLLDLFQEVLALLPPDARWSTSFETTVIGQSSSLLRGTYAGSAEAASGNAGLLVVDLTQRSPLPANFAIDELIVIAREGPKEAVAKGPPRIPGMPALPESTITEPSAAHSAGSLMPGLSGPPKAPASWDDDDEQPKSRLGWYILAGVLLAGVVLVGSLIGWWSWRTQQLRKKIEYYAAITNGEKKDACPTLEDWKWAYRDDEQKMQPTADEFDLLLSALRTKNVDAERLKTAEQRAALVQAVRNLRGKESSFEDAEKLGIVPAEKLSGEQKKAADQFFASWLNFRSEHGAANTPKNVGEVKEMIDGVTAFIRAVYEKRPDEGKKRIQQGVARIWPGKIKKDTPSDWIDKFQEQLDKQQNKLSYQYVSEQLDVALKPVQRDKLQGGGADAEQARREILELQEKAFEDLQAQLEDYNRKKRKPPGECTELRLAEHLDVGNLSLKLELPACGAWEPEVELVPDEKPTRWNLKGLPGEKDKTHFGTVILNKETGTLTYKFELASAEPKDALYVPLRFVHRDPAGKTEAVVIADKQTAFLVAEPENRTLYEILESGTLTLKTATDIVISEDILKHQQIKLSEKAERGEKPAFRLKQQDQPGNGTLVVDVLAERDPRDKTATGDIRLESFRCVGVKGDSGPWEMRVHREDESSLPWTERLSRLGKNPPRSPKDYEDKWKQGQWKPVVKRFLDESGRTGLVDLPSDDGAKVVVERWIEAAVEGWEDNEDRKLVESKKRTLINKLEGFNDSENHKVETESPKGVFAWQANAFEYLCKKDGPYGVFTTKKVEQLPCGKRPVEQKEPGDPGQAAPAHELAKYQLDKTEYQKNKEQLRKWDGVYRSELRSRQNIEAFLDERRSGANAESAPPPPCDAAAVVVLKWSEKVVAESASEAMKDVRLASLFTVTVDLDWTFKDGTPQKVHRLEIKPAPPPPAPPPPPDPDVELRSKSASEGNP
jgi:hypothetical protein